MDVRLGCILGFCGSLHATLAATATGNYCTFVG